MGRTKNEGSIACVHAMACSWPWPVLISLLVLIHSFYSRILGLIFCESDNLCVQIHCSHRVGYTIQWMLNEFFKRFNIVVFLGLNLNLKPLIKR